MDPLPPLLGLLVQGPQHGYQIKARIEREFGPFWRLDYAQLYRTLARAAAMGAATVRTEPGVRGPARKRYALTTAGRRRFEAWLQTPPAGLEEILVRLRLAHGAGLLTEDLQGRLREALAAKQLDRERDYRRARASGDAAGLVLAETARRCAAAVADAVQNCTTVPGESVACPGPVIIGSDDPLLTRLAAASGLLLETRGSYGGLWALSRGEADVAGLHLRDPDTREYNLPFVRRLLPEEDLLLVNVAWRETGLLLPAANPRRIRSVKDLAQRGLRLVNRQPAAGTRLLLYLQLRAAAVDPRRLCGWNDTRASHAAVAAAIRSGAADVGPGLRATAESSGLEFLPLARERYDLVVRRRFFDSRAAEPLHRALAARSLRRAAAGLAGYDLSASGKVVCASH